MDFCGCVFLVFITFLLLGHYIIQLAGGEVQFGHVYSPWSSGYKAEVHSEGVREEKATHIMIVRKYKEK